MAAQVHPLIVYVHLPKTAGTSMFHLFRALYGETRVFQERRGKDNRRQVYTAHPDPAALRVLLGHFPYDYPPTLNGRARLTLTMLRAPAARVHSLYHYLRRTEDHPLHAAVSKMSFAEYAASPLDPNAQNGMTRMLAGGGITWKPRLDRGDLQRAKAHLDACAAFGFSARMAESLALFEAVLGVEITQQAIVENTNPTPGDPPAEAVEVVRAHNTLDLELYEYAQDQFEKRLRLHDLAARIDFLKRLGW